MKRASVLVLLVLFVCMAGAPVAQAGGFGLFEWSNRAVGMGTANYAVGNDASVIAYNPAQMTQLKSHNILVGMTAIQPSSDVNITSNSGATGTGDFSTKDQTFFVPHAYYAGQLTDKVWVGFGEYTRFGLGTQYDDNWAGRNLLREIDLESFSFAPTIAFKFTDKLSIGANVEVLKGSLLLKKAHPAAAFYNSATVDVDGTAVGGTLSALYQFDDQWSLGFVYRSPVKFQGSGDIQIDGALAANQHGDATVSATFPSSYTLGLGYKPTDKWSIEADVIFTRWELFDKMDFEYSSNITAAASGPEYFYYKNTWRFQLGTEYLLTDWLALRAGYVYDQTPTRHEYASVMLPANDRQLFSLGTGFMFGNWTIDLSGMYIMTKEREGMTMVDGLGQTYGVDFKNGRTIVAGLSVGYAF